MIAFYLPCPRTCLFLLALSTPATLAAPVADSDKLLVNSTIVPGAYITYKPTEICETTSGVKSYSGYVHLPPNTLLGQDFEMHTYFWFFESRINPKTAPLSLWLQGGPGVPSVTSPLGANGPCSVNRDSATTELNPWSWNNEVNMLFIDQPVQVGLSYDSLVKGVVDLVASPFAVGQVAPLEDSVASNFTHPAGVFSSQDRRTTSNTTLHAAEAMWHVMQVWMQEFPKYKSPSNTLSIWSESYGGHYGPIFADYFTKQSAKLTSDNSSMAHAAKSLKIDTVGIINGCIDSTLQIPSYPEFAFNNTYGIQAYNETVYNMARGGLPLCQNLTDICSSLADEKDPEFKGNNDEVNKACQKAFKTCFGTVHTPYAASLRNVFDITSPVLSSFPPKFAAGYLNRKDIQDALGVPLNFTGMSESVAQVFDNTGDFMRGKGLQSLGHLLDSDVKVALVYGDKDYQCNWLGGEKVSLSIKSDSVPSASFRQAGYSKIEINGTYTGGLIRQVGRLSFARVFNAGHGVPYYQPETAYRIFQRVMSNQDVATGKTKATADYSSTGPDTAFALDGVAPALPPLGQEERDCYVWDIMETCDKGQATMIKNGTAITKDFIMVGFRLANGTDVLYSGEPQPDHSSSPTPTSAASAVPVATTAGGVAQYGSIGAARAVVVSVVVILTSGAVTF